MGAAVEPPDQAEPERLSKTQQQALVRALSEWAQRHPKPNRPVWGLAQAVQLTPNDQIQDMLSPVELVEAVKSETPVGERFMHSVGITLTEVSFEDYLRSIDRSATRPRMIEALLDLWHRVVRLF